ncbi:MAG: zinc ribbon domain-containing protein [Deltaproteobacteria bacterium]|nr:zinc ribbon domain-containing protein [Deltaproteobacteria bacterium]
MQATTARSCQECSTELLEGARFCRSCGASVQPPPQCPKCSSPVPADARFCGGCGAKLVGARPAAEAPEAPAAPTVAPSAVPAFVPTPESLVPPPVKKPGNNIGSNVLLFVAFLLVMVVVIYEMNKDAPKTVSPFEGGPPMAAPQGGAPPAAGGAEGAPAGDVPSGDPISGKIVVADGLNGAGSGTMFVILRNQGMPNKGPPLAVKKVIVSSFPAEFTLGPGDLMMQGMPFSGPFDIYVRLDGDGDPMTKAPGDLVNALPKSGVAPGATNVEVVLDQRL